MNNYFLENDSIIIPNYFINIVYNSKIIPNETKYDIIKTGANCQVFSYELLRFNNKKVPDLRSKELWEDNIYSKVIFNDFKPLDILFFNSKSEYYGAHLGVYIGNNKVLHISKDIGYPVIWEIKDFQNVEKYKFFLGAKRFFD
ncbi:MAG: cell wall hydrolase [Candidatus Gracilibacteria bacterium]|nr:cell wall hydrolase [Candidatus Gracilibacteria bacterium]